MITDKNKKHKKAWIHMREAASFKGLIKKAAKKRNIKMTAWIRGWLERGLADEGFLSVLVWVSTNAIGFYYLKRFLDQL